MSDSEDYASVESYPTMPTPPVTKPKPVAAAGQPPVSSSASSPRAPRKPKPRPKPVMGPDQHPKSSPNPQRRQHSGPSMLPRSPSWRSGSVSDDYAPPVPTSPRPVLPSVFRTPPPSRRAYPRNFAEGEASQLKRTQSMDDGSLTRASLSSPSNESLSLGNFVSRYGSSLPLHIRVDKGFCSAQMQYVISTGDEFIIQFTKHRKVITLTDSNACQCTIPSNSPIEVAPLYNPNNNTNEALKGFTFGSAGDIASLQSPLPKSVRVTKSYQGSDSKCSVEEGEILIVKKVSRTSVKRKLALKVFSITKNEEKILNEDCVGHFTTKPDDARFLLMQAIQHMPDPFPMEAMLYMTSKMSPELPLHLSSTVVTLTHSSIETFLVATPYCDDNTSPSEEEAVPLEIPIHLDIDVSVIPPQDQEAKNKVAQTSIHQLVQLGSKKRGIEIEKPAFVHDVRHRVSQTPPSSPKSSKVSEKASVVKDTPVESASGSSSADIKQQLAALQLSTESLKTAVNTIQANSNKQLTNIQDELVRLAPIVDNLSQRCSSTEEKLKRLKQLVMATLKQQQHDPAVPKIDASAEEQNKILTRSLTHTQVLELLAVMNLQQYQDTFKSEQINGEVLAECDEGVLEHELGITSRLHRLRLMKLITGKHSAAVFLESEDPYGQMKKQ